LVARARGRPVPKIDFNRQWFSQGHWLVRWLGFLGLAVVESCLGCAPVRSDIARGCWDLPQGQASSTQPTDTRAAVSITGAEPRLSSNRVIDAR